MHSVFSITHEKSACLSELQAYSLSVVLCNFVCHLGVGTGVLVLNQANQSISEQEPKINWHARVLQNKMNFTVTCALCLLQY